MTYARKEWGIYINNPVALVHGGETIKAKAERSAKSIMFRYLTGIGNHCEMFYKEIKTRDRPPLGYTHLDLNDKEQLVIAILKALPN